MKLKIYRSLARFIPYFKRKYMNEIELAIRKYSNEILNEAFDGRIVEGFPILKINIDNGVINKVSISFEINLFIGISFNINLSELHKSLSVEFKDLFIPNPENIEIYYNQSNIIERILKENSDFYLTQIRHIRTL